MVKLTFHWEGPPDHHDQKATESRHRCRPVRASNCRPQHSKEGRAAKLRCSKDCRRGVREPVPTSYTSMLHSGETVFRALWCRTPVQGDRLRKHSKPGK